MQDIQDSFKKIKEVISTLLQQRQKRVVDKHWRPLEFNKDDWALLNFTKAWLQQTTSKDWQGEPTGHQKLYGMLAKQYYGPFQILERINETSYHLKMPPTWHIHNTFHVNLLKPFKGTPPTEPIEEDSPEFDEQEEVLQPDIILRHEDSLLWSGKTLMQYLVKFRNYPLEDAWWMQETQLKDSMNILNKYKFLYELDQE